MQAHIFGIKDSINPCAVSTILIFIILVSHLGQNRSLIFLLGSTFVMSVMFLNVLIMLGFFDNWLFSRPVIELFGKSYMVMAVCYIFLGLVHLFDWYRFGKDHDMAKFKIKTPAFLSDTFGRRHSVLKVLMIFLYTIIVGSLITLLGSIWPMNYLMFVSYIYKSQQADIQTGLIYLFTYNFFLVLPLIFVWLLIFGIASFKGIKSTILKSVSLFKISAAAILISAGTGLIIFIHHQMNFPIL